MTALAAAEARNADSGTLTLAHRAYDLLRHDILSGALAPGSRLRIEVLKKRYGIGPTPLREALFRLLSDGIVSCEEHRGFSIPDVSLAELRDITDQRKMVECAAMRAAIANATDAYDAEVVAAHFRLSRATAKCSADDHAALQEWERLHRLFHQTLIEGANSPVLMRLQRMLYDQADRYRHLYLQDTFVPDSVHDDHTRLMEATLERDADKACALLSEHVERVHAIASQAPYFARQKKLQKTP
ncbi:GntR family transcriptional regulator [Telmatospirillum sp. J64-1]|uniref:GntR family transcriptional regulator n=1 Tax=Telmatospirillum sp. J64-1 TaxID=2502183 RepID=UPI00115F7401|nr:FCD domain-containing protein [Telmatospirillum sp. J64-1]